MPNFVDLTSEELDPNDAAPDTTFRPQLPFRPQDLARFTSKPGVDQRLNDDTINTFFEYFVDLHDDLSTFSSGIWLVERSEQNKLPCTPRTVFLLPVNIDAKHWVCLVLDVEERAAEMFDSLRGQDWDKTCLRFALRFIKWLPEPFNNPEGWHAKRPTYNPQQPNLVDCGPYCLAAALYRALGHQIPPSLDNRFLRSFFHSLAVNINFAAATSTSRIPDNDENQPSTSDLERLRYLHALPPDCIPEYQDQVPGLPLGNLDEAIAALSAATLDRFAVCEKVLLDRLAHSREVANSYIDGQVTALEVLKVAANPFVVLASTLCSVGKDMGERMDDLQKAEIALENIKKFSSDLSIINRQKEVMEIALRSMTNVHREKKRAGRLMMLERAVVQADVATVSEHLENVQQRYLSRK